jgi:hypothetical protein
MASISDCGADLRKSRLGIVAEHAASMKPPAMTVPAGATSPKKWQERRARLVGYGERAHNLVYN